MQVRFYATLRQAAGGKTLELDLPSPVTVFELLQAASRQRPALAQELWKSPGRLNDHIRVFVNGREWHFVPRGLETSLDASDTIDVFPPVGGG